MENIYKLIFDTVDENKDMILQAERHIWNNPETGYREWKTHAYLKEKFEQMGYSVTEAGNIPGFFCDVEFSKPGPKIAVFGEMDSLIVSTHPECDKETGAVHSCGHNCQCAALLGIAAALKNERITKDMCGSVRLVAVPAEELIELEYRENLRKSGVIKYFGGKQEFLYRGYLDGVDMAMMVHQAGGDGFRCSAGTNGCVIKYAEFKGKSCHASAPSGGVNALYAASTALSAANAIRETFADKDMIRFHPIITNGGTAVNSIPDSVTVESYIRGKTMDAIAKMNEKINRAFCASAAAMGGSVFLKDRHGYAPRIYDKNLRKAFYEVGKLLFDESKLDFNNDSWGAGCSDMGDISCVIPSVHSHIGGTSGAAHGADYYITDPYLACVVSAKAQTGVLAYLLSDNAKEAAHVIDNAACRFSSKEEFFRAADRENLDKDGVTYNGDGSVTLSYK